MKYGEQVVQYSTDYSHIMVVRTITICRLKTAPDHHSFQTMRDYLTAIRIWLLNAHADKLSTEHKKRETLSKACECD